MAFVVAIDGPAASGKGTIGRNVARHFDWSFLDTGLVYRAVARNLVKNNISLDPIKAIEEAQKLHVDDLEQEGLRFPETSRIASEVASIPGVRKALIDFQRNFASVGEGAVLDGRDIGTVICPDADIKFYITASQQVRAQRRFREVLQQGIDITYTEVFDALVERDMRDTSRSYAPLKQSENAILIDTSMLTIKQSLERVITKVELKLSGT